jgi:8-oxo-dGTP diphosphatase
VRRDADEFALLRDREAAQADWVVIGVVLNARHQVLLAYNSDDESWVFPGGALQTGESLSEGLVREVREKSGVPVIPGRPRALDEVVCHHAGETDGYRTVVFDATPESTESGENLGESGKSIGKISWFDGLPENVFKRASTAEALVRCRAKRKEGR